MVGTTTQMIIVAIALFIIISRTSINFDLGGGHRYNKFFNTKNTQFNVQNGHLNVYKSKYTDEDKCGEEICPGVLCEDKNKNKCAIYETEQQCKSMCKVCIFSKSSRYRFNWWQIKKNDKKQIYYCPDDQYTANVIYAFGANDLVNVFHILSVVLLVIILIVYAGITIKKKQQRIFLNKQNIVVE